MVSEKQKRMMEKSNCKFCQKEIQKWTRDGKVLRQFCPRTCNFLWRYKHSIVSEKQKIRIKNTKTNETSELNVSGVMIEVGQIPTTELAKKAGVKTDDNNFITTNKGQETNISGVFAAGDVTGTLAQITNSVGQGSLAATNAYFYIKKPEYKTLDYH